MNAAGALAYKHADFNKLRWLKASVIILSLVKTAYRISSVSFYTPEPPHSSWDQAEVLLRPLEEDAKKKKKEKEKLSVGWTQRATNPKTHSPEGREEKSKRNARRGVSRAVLSQLILTHFNTLHPLGNSGLSPRRYGRTYVFFHHRGVRWGTGSQIHKYSQRLWMDPGGVNTGGGTSHTGAERRSFSPPCSLLGYHCESVGASG